MPTYQYACTECGEQLEKVQKFTDEPLTVCEACGGRLRKVFSPVGIVFKGSGFYRTDSRNGGGSGSVNAKDGVKEKEKSTSDSSSAKSESSSSSDKATKTESSSSSSDTKSKKSSEKAA